MALVLAILSIIASWVYNLPIEWAVTITVFAALAIAEDGFSISRRK